ncbi:MAG: DUF4956 domain-containing protein [Clostridia bacterium]|nr:DUF4956 domain-containing protein [Clostridia bacterium]
MLENIFRVVKATESVQNCLLCLGVAIILGIVISYTHKATTKTTQNFLLTLGILPVLVEVIILLASGQVEVSLAVAGAFSLVRFRSMPGNSKEIVSVFWAMAIGSALGLGYIWLSVVVTIVVAILMFVYTSVLNKSVDNSQRRLKIVIPENLDYDEVFKDLLKKHTTKYELRKAKTTNMGSTYELTYLISMKKDSREKQFIDEIRIRNGNMTVLLERPELSEVEL